MSKHSILAIGGIYVDINCHDVDFVDAIPAETEIDGAPYEILAGGSGVNFGRLCVQLGLQPSFIGKVGDDHMGRLAATLLQEDGIQPYLAADSTVSTQIAMNFINNRGQTVMPGAGNANPALDSEDVIEILEHQAKDIDYLYLGSCLKLKRLIPAYTQIIEIARRHGAKIIVDHGRTTSAGISADDIATVKELVLASDYYLPSTEEFLQVWEVGTIEEGLQKLAGLSDVRVVVKDGQNGAFSLDQGKLVHSPAYQVEARYMVGAGDSFNAGFVAAQASGKGLANSLAYGCAVAGLKVSGQQITEESIQALQTS